MNEALLLRRNTSSMREQEQLYFNSSTEDVNITRAVSDNCTVHKEFLVQCFT